MLIIALVLAVVALAALVTAVVTSNEVVAWACIAASSVGVLLLIVDAVRDRQARRTADALPAAGDYGHDVDDATAVIAGDETMAETTEFVTDAGPETDTGDFSAESEIAEVQREVAVEDHPEEIVHDEPEYDTYSDDEPDYPQAAEESAVHIVDPEQADTGDAERR